MGSGYSTTQAVEGHGMCGGFKGCLYKGGPILLFSCGAITQLSSSVTALRQERPSFPFLRFMSAWPVGPTEFKTLCYSTLSIQKAKCGLEVPAHLLNFM